MADQADKKPKYDIKEILASYRPLIVPELERIFPRKVTAEHMEKVYGKPRYEYDCAALSASISTPAWELLDRKGKMWRPGLLFLVAEALGKSIDDVKNFVAICEGVHSATLLVDDIEDSSDLRRGKPAIHLMFGVDVAINCGNGMYYMPLMALKQFEPPLAPATLLRCYETYSFEMCQLHFGQGMDIWWHSGKAEQEPTTQQYLQMCACKTGTLARMSAKLSAIACGASDDQIEAIGCFAETIGVAFQIQDDILNLVGEKFGELKGVGEDIHEGKRTLMVLHSLQTADKAKAERLTAILNSHPEDQAVINEAIEIIKSTDSIEHARSVAKKIVQDAWIGVESSLQDSAAKDKLQAFARYLIDREI